MRILLAEDDPTSRRMLELLLDKMKYETVSAANGRAALEILTGEDPPEMAILDWMMPQVDGVEVCRAVRKSSSRYIYLLMLTQKDGASNVVAGLEAGADDYLTKPFNINELQARMRTGERILKLQRDLLAAQADAQQQATYDSLTGLYNRGAVGAALERDMARSRRTQEPLSILLVDLDQFKQLNDQHGHLAGDATLHQTAQAMQKALRKTDLIGRYGGEEFLAVLPACDHAGALEVAERLRRAVASTMVAVDEKELLVTCSIGAATMDPADATLSAFVQRADFGLYAAKHAGRNCTMSGPIPSGAPLAIEPVAIIEPIAVPVPPPLPLRRAS